MSAISSGVWRLFYPIHIAVPLSLPPSDRIDLGSRHLGFVSAEPF
jgi:hypothetical protein